MDRRKSLKTSGVLLGTALLSPLPAESSQASDGKTVTTFIDLTKCDGCRGEQIPRCVKACREENASQFPEPKKPIPDVFPTHMGMPYAFSWWAFTFPSGALAAVSTGITYVVFKFSSLYQIFWLLNVFLIGVWIIVAGLTARAVVKGEAFKGH